ncbi:class I tRNA ligase family protein, partial [uncultured Wocania sp.]|uniref:class I tRNA ligase family protein n=1 Tax=uncultured Wocania sp. TaxID=2834404 RepID=UPI0030FC9CE3
PTETGEPPLGNATVWAWDTNKNEVVSNDLIDNKTIHPLELNTMPGWAGSSFYFMRYMDPENQNEIASKEAMDYWQDVDLYIGGSEHATGHLLYSRFWQKFLFDKGVVPKDEYAKKLINQGMILGDSAFVHRVGFNFGKVVDTKHQFTKEDVQNIKLLRDKYSIIENIYLSNDIIKYLRKSFNEPNTEEEIEHMKLRKNLTSYLLEPILKDITDFNLDGKVMVNTMMKNYFKTHVSVDYVNTKNELDWERLKQEDQQYSNAEFITNKGNKYVCKRDVEKMSKSKYNVVNPDDIVSSYGADSLRLYEMFLGPLEQYKPWNTAGITGVHSFLKKLWKLYHQGENGSFYVSISPPSEGLGEALKTLHKTIKKVQEDIENFSFNTSVSTFMIAVNELTAQKCNSKEILEPLLVLISPYAPHIAEELWSQLGNSGSISTAPFPEFDASHLVESSKNYPISFNGKMRFTMELPLDLSKDDIEKAVLAHEKTQEQLAGRTPKKVIVVPGKIVNIVG